MKRLTNLIFIFILILSIVGCSTGTPPSPDQGGDSNDIYDESGDGDSGGDSDITDNPPSAAHPKEEIEIFNELFDTKNHIYIHLDITSSELKKIQQDYEKYSAMGSKSPIYRMADMTIKITKPDGSTTERTIEQVGVRMKGNTSRTSFYSDSDGMYNLIHFKISFGETFDDAAYYGDDALSWPDSAARKERKDRTFATLEKIDMKWNRNDDATYIRESYAYELYREFGVLAPHTALASTDIGKDHAGVFVIYEPIDKIFLEKNLPASALGGDLYKLGWTNEGATFSSFSSYGVEDEDDCEFYVYDLKTNKKTSDHSSLKALINTLNSSNLTKDDFASVVDVENLMYYCAVSYMVGNPDDLRNNYNNAYIYFRQDTGEAIIIPYDFDRAFGINTWNPYGNGMTSDNPFTKYNVCGERQNPLFSKSICQGGMFIDEYIDALRNVDASEMLTDEHFEKCFDMAAALYSKDVTPSKAYSNASLHKFCFDIGTTCSAEESKNMSFADYLCAKRQTLHNAIDGNNDFGNDIYNDICYIRADFTEWANDDRYQLRNTGDGIYTITFTMSSAFRFKVYNNTDNTWLGGEILDKNCSVNYSIESGYNNICLSAGTYTVTYNSANNIIFIANG